MTLNLPNLVTLLRIVLIPLIVGLYYVPDDWLSLVTKNIAATAIFIFAAITDWLDGYLARRLNQVSAFGAFLDPVADKLMVVGALLVLLHEGRVDTIVALVIVGREIAISALREWMALIGQSQSVAVAFIGKVKTVIQMIAIPVLLYDDDILGIVSADETHLLGTALIYVAALLTVISMLYYLRMAYPHSSKAGML